MQKTWNIVIASIATALGTSMAPVGRTTLAELPVERTTLAELKVDLDANGQEEVLRVVRNGAGRTELIVRNGKRVSRVRGFHFGMQDPVQLSVRDANADGLMDVVLSNFRTEVLPGAASPGPQGPATLETHAIPTVYTVVTPAEGFPQQTWVDTGADNSALRYRFSFLGDRDNFGFGIGTGPPPCNFFDNSGPPDLGVFDREINGTQEVDTWTHTLQPVGIQLAVALVTWEIFSDDTSSTIALDGNTLVYATENFATCSNYPEGGVRRVHILIGADAQIVADGSVTVVHSESGDDVSIDASFLLAVSWVFTGGTD